MGGSIKILREEMNVPQAPGPEGLPELPLAVGFVSPRFEEILFDRLDLICFVVA